VITETLMVITELELPLLPLIFWGYTTASPKQAAAGSLLYADEMQMPFIHSSNHLYKKRCREV